MRRRAPVDFSPLVPETPLTRRDSQPRRNPSRPAAVPGAVAWPARGAIVAVAAWILLLAVAPPARNVAWGVNALRSIGPGIAAALAVLALASVFLPLARRPLRATPWLAGAAIVLAAVGPFRDTLHALGDSETRWGSIWNFARRTDPRTIGEWARALHMQPFDLATGLVLPAWCTRVTGHRDLGIALVAAPMLALFLAAMGRIARRLGSPPGAEPGAWLALVLTGGLAAFAGYVESAGVLLLTAAWWWVAMLAPLRRSRDAVLLALAWVGVFLAHRIAMPLLLPQLVRVLGPPHAGDDPRARRVALGATLVAGVAAYVALPHLPAGRIGSDLAELVRPPDPDTLPLVPTDLVNLLVVLAPLAVLAPLLAGRAAAARAARDPRAWCLGAGVLVLLPSAFPMPYLESGLALPRDWDLAALLGLTLTIAAGLVLASAAPERRRGTLVFALPVLVLVAGGWLAVNADVRAGLARVQALLDDTPHVGARAAAGVELLLGDRAVEELRMEDGARWLERSWNHLPTPARGLHGARAWLYAGDPDASQRMLDGVRARGGLSPRQKDTADSVQSYIDLLRARLRAAGAAPGAP